MRPNATSRTKHVLNSALSLRILVSFATCSALKVAPALAFFPFLGPGVFFGFEVDGPFPFTNFAFLVGGGPLFFGGAFSAGGFALGLAFGVL